MNKRLLLFNAIFYAITLTLIYKGKKEASSSLGYGFAILVFWLIAFATLIFFLANKVFKPKTLVDKIGTVTASPLLCVITVWLFTKFKETAASEWHFTKDNHRYKVRTFNHSGTANPKRIEYYKSVDTVSHNSPIPNIDKWVKDSTWIYFSFSGDTSSIIKYKDDLQIQ